MENKYFEFPELEIGEEFETDRGEKFKVVGKREDGCPICEPISKITMDFGGAIKALKEGRKVARMGWNGKGMFLWLKPATDVKAEWCKDPLLKGLAEENGGSIAALGTICMYTHDSTGRKAILTGWLASQSDMLLEDWIIVE
jgi:hypothetical protein